MNNTFCSKCHRIPSQCRCSPVKELTDDEIQAIWIQCFIESTAIQLPIAEFARAILKKAGEK